VTDKQRAIHEAGHAVFTLVRYPDRKIKEVTIDPYRDERGSWPGGTRMHGVIHIPFSDVTAPEVKMAIAGFMSGAAATDLAGHGADCDTPDDGIPPEDVSTASKWIAWLCETTKEHPGAVTAECFAMARIVLQERWRSVRRIANALLRERTISGERCTELAGLSAPRAMA
jgi:hypothetical protein